MNFHRPSGAGRRNYLSGNEVAPDYTLNPVCNPVRQAGWSNSNTLVYGSYRSEVNLHPHRHHVGVAGVVILAEVVADGPLGVGRPQVVGDDVASLGNRPGI